jgi:hypothetical protein
MRIVDGLVDGGQLGRRARDRDAVLDAGAKVLGHRPLDQIAHLVAQRSELLGGGWVVVQMALALADRARLGGDVERGRRARPADHELGAAAADVDHERLGGRSRACGRGAEERQPRLLVAADRARVDAEALAQLAPELLAVGAVAHRAGGHRHHVVRAVPVDQPAVLLERRVDALHGAVGKLPARVDAFAETRHLRAPLDLLDTAVAHLRDEQAGGVRAQVHDCDRVAHPRHPRGGANP